MTIRRDLHLLEEQGYATIHYGGAALLDRQNIGCQSFSLRKGKESENKRKIARRAASFIKEGDENTFYGYQYNCTCKDS